MRRPPRLRSRVQAPLSYERAQLLDVEPELSAIAIAQPDTPELGRVLAHPLILNIEDPRGRGGPHQADARQVVAEQVGNLLRDRADVDRVETQSAALHGATTRAPSSNSKSAFPFRPRHTSRTT